MKSGWKTSEFWLSLAAVVVGACLASGVFPSDSQWEKLAGVAVTVLAAFGYTKGRVDLKKVDQNEAKTE
jgi:hypothetical protein